MHLKFQWWLERGEACYITRVGPAAQGSLMAALPTSRTTPTWQVNTTYTYTTNYHSFTVKNRIVPHSCRTDFIYCYDYHDGTKPRITKRVLNSFLNKFLDDTKYIQINLHNSAKKLSKKNTKSGDPPRQSSWRQACTKGHLDQQKRLNIPKSLRATFWALLSVVLFLFNWINLILE